LIKDILYEMFDLLIYLIKEGRMLLRLFLFFGWFVERRGVYYFCYFIDILLLVGLMIILAEV
jgi:hypothetical protein